MNKTLVLTTIISLMTGAAFCQDLLDTDKYKDAEIFVVKKGYDVQQRLEEIQSIVGKEVTVYQVSGKQNKIKLNYAGTAEMSDHPKFSDKDRASLIIVGIKENGTMRAYFPLTNDSKYRIYLTEDEIKLATTFCIMHGLVRSRSKLFSLNSLTGQTTKTRPEPGHAIYSYRWR